MIITLSELKAYLWIIDTTQDTLLTILVNSANDFVENYIDRKIAQANYTEYFDWNAQRELLLSNYPVNSITSFKINIWTLETPVYEDIEANTYKLSPKVWKIFLNFYQKRWFQNYEVIYNAWYATIPWDLKLATLKIASWYYNKRTSDWIKSESVAWDSIWFDTSEISSDTLVILNNYRDV